MMLGFGQAHLIKYTTFRNTNQNAIDNIAALTLSSYTKKLEKETEFRDERTETQLVYGRIASMAYARSNLNEVGVVPAVHNLLYGTTYVRSHDFQTLHFCRHLQDLTEEEGYLPVLKKDDLNVSFNVTQNYNLRPKELENENLYDYTENYCITGQIPNKANSNPNCMFLHLDHPFQDKNIVKRRKVSVVPDIVGPRLPELFDIEEEEF